MKTQPYKYLKTELFPRSPELSKIEFSVLKSPKKNDPLKDTFDEALEEAISIVSQYDITAYKIALFFRRIALYAMDSEKGVAIAVDHKKEEFCTYHLKDLGQRALEIHNNISYYVEGELMKRLSSIIDNKFCTWVDAIYDKLTFEGRDEKRFLYSLKTDPYSILKLERACYKHLTREVKKKARLEGRGFCIITQAY